MKRIIQGFAAVALVAMAASCTTDNATQINYGVYATRDLLALTTPEVVVTKSNGYTERYTLAPSDFKISPDLHITAGNQGLLYWGTDVHFDDFGVESTITVTFKPHDGVDLSTLSGTLLLGSGIVGDVSTTSKDDGDFIDRPIYQQQNATQFTLPADAEKVTQYLQNLADNPLTVTVTVDATGNPIVVYSDK